jgi:predicted nucleic acid-binding protein
MPVVIDTSVWVEYFRNDTSCEKLDMLIDEDLVVTNDLILAELVPFLKIRNQRELVELLFDITKLDLSIQWDNIIDNQVKCLKSGINSVGIPDLVIAQNAKQHHCEIYSLDNHFRLMKDILGLKLLH